MSSPPTQILVGDTFLPLLDGTIRGGFVGIEGPRGTGKTRAILTLILCRLLRNPGARWLVCRSTRTRLSETVLNTLEEQVFPAFGMRVPGGAGRENRHRYDLPNGSVILPQGLDDPQRTQSLETAGIYVAEAVELASMDTVLALAGAMRQAVQPTWEPDFVHQCFVDMNPGPPGHWTNQIMEPVPKEWRRVSTLADYRRLLEHARRPPPEGTWKRLITRHQDNPHFFDVKAWDWTPAGRAYLATLAHLKGHLRRRWLDGDWIAAEGTVFPEFDEDRHVCTPFKLPPDWPIFWGYDPGVDHPTAILWFAVAPNGCTYIVDEIYGGGQSIPAHAANVKAHEQAANWQPVRRYGDPQEVFNRQKFSARTIAAHWADEGLRIVPWPRTGNNSRDMVEGVRKRLIDGTLKVFAPCRHTIDEFQSWSYKRTAKGELPSGDDQFEDKDNHAMDVVKGVLAAGIAYDRRRLTVLGAE